MFVIPDAVRNLLLEESASKDAGCATESRFITVLGMIDKSKRLAVGEPFN